MNFAVNSNARVNKSGKSGGIFDQPKLQNELDELDRESSQPDFWKDATAAAKVGRAKSRDRTRHSPLQRF